METLSLSILYTTLGRLLCERERTTGINPFLTIKFSVSKEFPSFYIPIQGKFFTGKFDLLYFTGEFTGKLITVNLPAS